jgi:hypothetical protein
VRAKTLSGTLRLPVWHGPFLFFVRFLESEGVIGRNCGIASGLVRRGSVLGAWPLACREVESNCTTLGSILTQTCLQCPTRLFFALLAKVPTCTA